MRKIPSAHKIRVILIIFFLSLSAVVAILLSPVVAQTNPEEGQSDAIAVRIIPNPDHFSIARWYESQGFRGSPQALKVDGYDALRDGRTVYVNAANIVPETNELYTNIYLISYNQESQNKTVDILAQIISRWQFNENIEDGAGLCSLSAFKCESDADCTNLQTCDAETNTCALKEARYCATDDDCPVNFFCDSTKAKIIRDINRVGKLEELKEALAKYRQQNRHYPLLASGSYLAGTSISVWPSWGVNFLSSLPGASSAIDPINILGPCPGYNVKTCWNAENKKFFSTPGDFQDSLSLPKNSYVFMYSTNSAGSDYNLCAKLENPYSFQPRVDHGDCAVSSAGAGGSSGNQAPRILNVNLSGVAGQEFNGFVLAHDPEGDPLTWSLIIDDQDWSGWSAQPELQGTGNPNQKRIYASKAGIAPGEQVVTIVVRDNKGAQSATTTKIILMPSPSYAEASDYVYRLSLDPSQPFDYNFQIAGEGGAPNFSLSAVNGLNVLSLLESKVTASGVNRKRVMYQGTLPTSTIFSDDVSTNYRLSVSSPNGSTAVSNFNITVKAERPSFNLDCSAKNRVGYDYSCLVGKREQGFFDVDFRMSSESILSLGLYLVEKENGEFYIEGRTLEEDEGNEMTVVATNDYGTQSLKSLNLQVTSYCGDGIKQYPNTEGRGGLRNNGQEMCDGAAGIAGSALSSSPYSQYACNTPPNVPTSYPINDSSHCIFKSPFDGGGYCGDTYCQVAYESLEFCDLECCKFDCDPNYYGSYTAPTPPTLDPGLPDGTGSGGDEPPGGGGPATGLLCNSDADCADPNLWCANIPGTCRGIEPHNDFQCAQYNGNRKACESYVGSGTINTCTYFPSGQGECLPLPVTSCPPHAKCPTGTNCINYEAYCRQSSSFPIGGDLSTCFKYKNVAACEDSGECEWYEVPNSGICQ